ncbi:hypothetical protein HDE_03762 [Halotydeus destructor]|nr:hypothetical protein HDE_03762 [Halotydeus destructor]
MRPEYMLSAVTLAIAISTMASKTNAQGSTCDADSQCWPGYICSKSFDSLYWACLPLKTLYESCDSDRQCYTSTAKSECRRGSSGERYCQCPSYYPEMYGQCRDQLYCRDTSDCKYGGHYFHVKTTSACIVVVAMQVPRTSLPALDL